MNKKLLIIIILALGFLLRIVFINTNPPSLYGDELTITLDSYSLLKTGHDQLGNLLPLTFKMGAGRPAGYVYGSIPFIAIFGPNALGVRALSILSGLGIIILIYLLTKKILNEKVALAAAVLASVSPWDIALSRGGFEAHFALFLALLGTYLFIKAKEKSIFYIFSALSFGLTFHTYPTYKLSLLLFLPLLIWYQGRLDNLKKKSFIVGVALLILLGVLALSQTFINGSESRFSNINIFSKRDLAAQIEQKINFERSISNLPQQLSKYFHNKQVEYGKVFIENYLQNFSPDFLILHGDRNPRHNMVTMGEIYFVDAILIIVGLLTFWQKQKKIILFLSLWIFLAPLPTAIIDLPHALRSAFMLPPLILLSALGLTTILKQKKVIIVLISAIFLIQFLFFAQKIYFLSADEYASFWAFPAKLASKFAIENKKNYDYIILSDQIDSLEFAFPVYDKVDPREVINQNNQKTSVGEYQFKKFENVYIGYIPDGNIQEFINSLNGSVLFIGSVNQKEYIKDHESIENKDKTVAFILTRKK